MSDWWTYRPEDLLLFSSRTYWRLFELANAEVWPLQILIFFLGALTLIWVFRPRPWSNQVSAVLVSSAWVSAGFWFIGVLYAQINWAVVYAVPAFVAEAILFIWFGVIRQELRVTFRWDLPGIVGLGLFAYALMLHPLVAPLSGRPLAAAEIIAIAPDPTAIATLGLIAMAPRGKTIWLILLAPILWCIVTTATLFTMGAWEGWIPLTAIILALMARILASSKARPTP